MIEPARTLRSRFHRNANAKNASMLTSALTTAHSSKERLPSFANMINVFMGSTINEGGGVGGGFYSKPQSPPTELSVKRRKKKKNNASTRIS